MFAKCLASSRPYRLGRRYRHLVTSESDHEDPRDLATALEADDEIERERVKEAVRGFIEKRTIRVMQMVRFKFLVAGGGFEPPTFGL
jgi:hypothetical protein